MHEAYTRTGKITYTGGHTEDELAGIQLEIQGIPTYITLEKDGFKSTVETSETVKLNINFEYEADALTALDSIIAAAVEAKRAIESRHKTMANDLKTWANVLKETQKRCKVCGSKENLEAHHLESKHYSPSLMLSLGNGIVLCDQCHDDFHAFCGGKKASRHDFHRWLQERAKGNRQSKPSRQEKTVSQSGQSKVDIAVQCAIKLMEQNKPFTVRELAEMAGCSLGTAQNAMNKLKEQKIAQ